MVKDRQTKEQKESRNKPTHIQSLDLPQRWHCNSVEKVGLFNKWSGAIRYPHGGKMSLKSLSHTVFQN